MQITDKHALSAIMTAMYVAKWESDDENAHVMELVGSPQLAQVFHEIVDELGRLDADEPGGPAKWDRWRSLEERPDMLERTRARILRHSPRWRSWTREQRLDAIEILISPFRATAETKAALAML